MPKKTDLPSSPTPANLANAYGALVLKRAKELGGVDKRVTQGEAHSDQFVADAHRRTKKDRPTAFTVADKARKSMFDAAKKVAGDGRVSGGDAQRMPAIFAQGFQALRGNENPSAALLERLGKAAEGLVYISESDDPYVPFSVKVPANEKMTLAKLKEVLTWDTEEGYESDEYNTYPRQFQIVLGGADDHFGAPQDELTPDELIRTKATDKILKHALKPMTITDEDGKAVKAKVFFVTVREEDSSRAPAYLIGRLPSGEIVGLKTWRTWT